MAAKNNFRFNLVIVGALSSVVGASTTHAITPDNPGGGSVQFTINSGQNVKAISPWIYGVEL
jgi:hypothetical protein